MNINRLLKNLRKKKTTDDCYTPDLVYAAVADFVAKEYLLKRETFFRPFYPGGDYQGEDYRGKVVVDNPPFSILSEILRFYNDNGVKFFLFAPSLTLFSAASSETCAALPCGVTVEYENGAKVATSFYTNLEPSDVRVRVIPDLYKKLKEANDENVKQYHKQQRKYVYPFEVLTSTACARLCKYGQALIVKKVDSTRVQALDSQRASGDAIFGGGYLLSERAAAERAAAERAAAERAAAERAAAERAAAERAAAESWALSEAERKTIASLGEKEHD